MGHVAKTQVFDAVVAAIKEVHPETGTISPGQSLTKDILLDKEKEMRLLKTLNSRFNLNLKSEQLFTLPETVKDLTNLVFSMLEKV